ncbi:hypothetical protein AAY473_015034 [Plecturocebus cupreus]
MGFHTTLVMHRREARKRSILKARHSSSHLKPQHFGRPRQVDHLSPGVQDQSGKHGNTPSLQKYKKLARSWGVGLWSQLVGRLRQENHLSPDQKSEAYKMNYNLPKIKEVTKGLTLWPTLECSGAILAHCDLRLPGSQLGFHHIGQADLKLLTSGDPPTSVSQSAGITGVSCRTRPTNYVLSQEGLYWFSEPFHVRDFVLRTAEIRPKQCPQGRLSLHLSDLISTGDYGEAYGTLVSNGGYDGTLFIKPRAYQGKQAGVRWHDHGTLQSQHFGLKLSSHLRLLSNWDHKQRPPHLGSFSFLWESCSCQPRLEGSGTISAYCNLVLLGSSDPLALASRVAGITSIRHHAWITFEFLVETRFRHVGQADLKLLTSGDLPALASQSAGITGVLISTTTHASLGLGMY